LIGWIAKLNFILLDHARYIHHHGTDVRRIHDQMLPKKKFGSEKREKKNKMKANKITTNELKKNYDVLYKGPFFHIMPKTRKTLGITLLIKL